MDHSVDNDGKVVQALYDCLADGDDYWGHKEHLHWLRISLQRSHIPQVTMTSASPSFTESGFTAAGSHWRMKMFGSYLSPMVEVPGLEAHFTGFAEVSGPNEQIPPKRR